MLEFDQSCLKQIEDLKNQCNPDNLEKAFDDSMDDARQRCFDLAVGNCPKDTGQMAEMMYSYNTDNGFTIGNNAPYAVFNEYGSIYTPIGDVSAPVSAKKVGVRPFIRPAILQTRQEFPDLFGKKFQELVAGGKKI